MPPIAVSRPLLFGLVAVGALLAIAMPQPTSSFAAGFAAGAGSVFVISFMKSPRGGGPEAPPAGGGTEEP